MKTRSVICGSMMLLLAACSGSSDEGGDSTGSEGTASPPTSASAKETPPAPPAPSAPSDSPNAPPPPAEQAPEPPAQPPAIAPTITSMLPADGASGVALTPEIKVTFSRSMDRASTEAAFTLEDPLPIAGAFTWADDDKILTFKPSSPVANDIALTAKVAVSAKDKQGTNLAAPLASSFSTLRKTTIDLPSGTIVQCSSAGPSVYIGQFFVGDDVANKTYRAFATFDLSTLPADLTSIDDAWLILRNGDPQGKASPIVAESIDYGPALDCVTDYASPVRTFVNPFTKANVPLRSDVVKKGDTIHGANLALAVAFDWADRQKLGNRSMIRIQLSGPATADGIADGMKWDGASTITKPTLSVTIQHP